MILCTEIHSFPLQVSGFEEVAEKGAYATDIIYTPADVQDIVTYATEVRHNLYIDDLGSHIRNSVV